MSETHNTDHIEASAVASDDRLRSHFVRELIAAPTQEQCRPLVGGTPRVLIQYWNDLAEVPDDVMACISTWAAVEAQGFERVLFDDVSARTFIEQFFDDRCVRAFDRCNHPAMRADYFRLCFIACRGGVYVDADDEFAGGDLAELTIDGRVRIQPLCYQVSSNSMLNPYEYACSQDDDLIFYVNNNPLIAPPGHPLLIAALEQATQRLIDRDDLDRNIQSLTGPGNISEALVRHAITLQQLGQPMDFVLIEGWDDIAPSKWPLGYRGDSRNWRRWVAEAGSL